MRRADRLVMSLLRSFAFSLAGLSALVLLTHCSSSGSIANGGNGNACGTPPSSPVGRPQPGVCPATNIAGDGYPDGGPQCTTLADCPTPQTGTFHACLQGRCSFDLCLTDADCPSGQACGCANAFGGNGEHVNACVPAQCRVDSDCGTNGACSASDSGGCGGLSGFYCHSAADQCQTDADCCGDEPQCRYQPMLGHWACQAVMICNG